MFVEREALITLATVAADRVLASTVQAHAREFNALVHILTLSEAVPTWAQLSMGLRAQFRAQFALVATPGTAYRTTAKAFGEMPFYGTSALAVTIVQVANFLPGVDASGICNRILKKYRGCFKIDL